MRKGPIQPQGTFSGMLACFYRRTAGALPVSSLLQQLTMLSLPPLPFLMMYWGSVYFKQIQISILCEIILCDKIYLMSFYFLYKLWFFPQLLSFPLIFITIPEIKLLLYLYSISLIFNIIVEIKHYDPTFTQNCR